MREILFRGKREDNGEWVYGMPCATRQSGIYAIQTLDGGIFDVIPETVGQYTGLTDKTSSMIFEGDILLVKTTLDSLDKTTRDDEYTVMGVVVFNEGHFELEGKGLVLCTYWGLKSLYTAAHFKEYEVIGNIHDNPELLKGREEL